ncbi:MAG: TylF/MycF/NovP-related O-methyltransferase [Clostridia bacterium]
MALTYHINYTDKQEFKTYRDILPEEDPDDAAFVEIMKKIDEYTMTVRDGLEATYSLFQAVKYLAQNRIAGDIVECGVWRGGSMMLVAHALQHFGDSSRELYLYDTFAGMTEPEDVDIDMDGNPMKPFWEQARRDGKVIGFGGVLDEVMSNLRGTGYPEAQTFFVEGDVLETIPAYLPERIALLRLDTDWYKSTFHELTHLYDLLVPNGVLIVDDYGWNKGSRKATDDFFRARAFRPLMHRVDEKVRMLVKPVS